MRRVQLMEAAMQTIAAYGLPQTTIAHVSAAAGMSRGIINFYFKSKDAMLKETLAYLLSGEQEAIESVLEKHASSTAQDRLLLLIETLCSTKLYSKKRLGVWCAFAAHAATHAPTRYAFEQAYSALIKQFALLCKELGVPNPDSCARHVLVLIQGMRLTAVTGTATLEPKNIVDILMAAKSAGAQEMPVKPAAKVVALSKPSDKKQTKKKSAGFSEDPPVVADLFSAL